MCWTCVAFFFSVSMFSCFGGWQVICCIFFFIGVIPNGTGLFSSLQRAWRGLPTPPRSYNASLCTCTLLSVLSTCRIAKYLHTHRVASQYNHMTSNSRRNTVSQPSNGSNTSQCTVSSHLCLASSAVGGGGAVREGRANFGIVVLSAACVLLRGWCSEFTRFNTHEMK